MRGRDAAGVGTTRLTACGRARAEDRAAAFRHVHFAELIKHGEAPAEIQQFLSSFPKNVFDLPLRQEDARLAEYYIELVRPP